MWWAPACMMEPTPACNHSRSRKIDSAAAHTHDNTFLMPYPFVQHLSRRPEHGLHWENSAILCSIDDYFGVDGYINGGSSFIYLYLL
jgi:hypothetical protein